jgi:hypothetical protein
VALVAHTGPQQVDDAAHPAADVDRPRRQRQAEVVEQLVGLWCVHLSLSDEVLQLGGCIAQQVPPGAGDLARR